MATSDNLGEFSGPSSGLSDLDSGGISQGGKETVTGMVVNFSARGEGRSIFPKGCRSQARRLEEELL